MLLLPTFLSRFTTPADAPPAPIEPALQQPEPPSMAHLRPLARQRQLLTIRHEQQRYQSLILALDTERQLMWLDDLFPHTIALQVGDQLTIEHAKHGQLLSFTAPMVGWASPRQRGGIALPLPEHISIGPRRRWPRLDVFGWHPISARLAVPGSDLVSGEIINVSAGGVRLSISGDWRARLRHGDHLPLCEFTVTEDLRVRCRVRVCAYELAHRPWRQTRISLAFEDISTRTQRALAHYIEETMARHHRAVA